MSALHRSLWALTALAVLPSACAHRAPSTTSQVKDVDWDVREFYRPPSPLPNEAPGFVLDHEPLTGLAALEGTKLNERVLYLSNSGGPGETPIAVSGIIAVPEGEEPTGGWPVVTWAHGTLGIADKCAPSRDELGASAHWYNQAPHRLLNQFLKQGWAVVMSDYEGLGTPGRHPYLLGNSQAYGVLDIVRAAHALHGKKLSKKFAIVGHSQGGQAALFAAARAPERLKDDGLELVGVLAYAPASAMEALFYAGTAQTSAGPNAAFMPLFLTGAIAGNPSELTPENILQDEAQRLYAYVDTQCRTELSEAGSWGGFVPAGKVLKLTAPVLKLNAQLRAMEPGALTVTTPVRLVQGGQDERVNPAQTALVSTGLISKGAQVEYVGCPVADHFGVLGDDIPGTLAWLKQRLTGEAPSEPVLSSCQRVDPPPGTPSSPAR
ncbi:alpha/beta fold hydrolase [Corallococcus exiguus]|uniref:alpha/beta hydrolase family protein n=1 Tax=Corallococcus exiguus TaxID=83462 RepID=UPI0014940CA3|nr:alpha/beta fold hydrolase [Corallococcus exiguus]NPC74803.1 alpha/beta fold hydrolase [Corallococcus exiguus]